MIPLMPLTPLSPMGFYGSKILADILYTFKAFKTLANGTRVVSNIGKLGDAKDAVLGSGQGIYLNGVDQYVDVPINYDGSTVQGSITTFNFDTKEFEQVGADGVGSKELVTNGDFSDGLNGWNKTNDGTIENIGGELVATIGSGYVAPYSSIATSGRLIISADSIQSNSSTGLYMWVSAHQLMGHP